MNLNYKTFYDSLDEETRHVYHVLALWSSFVYYENIFSVVNIQKKMIHRRLKEILEEGLRQQLIKSEYSHNFTLDGYFKVWLYPFANGLTKEKAVIEEKEKYKSSYNYSNDHRFILNYLNAIYNLTTTDNLKKCEENLLRYQINHINYLVSILDQPLYDRVIDKISNSIMEIIYRKKSSEIISKLDSFDILFKLDNKLSNRKLDAIKIEQTKIAFKTGNFQKAQQMINSDSLIGIYVKASEDVINGNFETALIAFEKCLKSQRRDLKQSYLPIIPELAFYYFVAVVSQEQEKFLPVIGRILDPKTKQYANTDLVFIKLCQFMTSNNIEYYTEWFEEFEKFDSQELILWKIIALGYIGEKSLKKPAWIKEAFRIVKKAYTNGYLPAAYEAAWALKNMGSKEAEEIFKILSEKLKYKPVLSTIKRVEEWEKQLNAYLSLEAVKTAVKLDIDAGKTRVAYRFYPNKKYAIPILQSRLSNGKWNAGRNIAMKNFSNCLVDEMTAQDKRIASATDYFSNSLSKSAIVEMTGHPFIFLEDSDIPVELVASKPVLSVVESEKGIYKVESSVTDIQFDTFIEKETNTRYKIYRFDKHQKEIIDAVKKGKKIPEAGKEKLMTVLQHFSAYMTIQTDLDASNTNIQVKQVDADSRLRVQLLPLGEGLKAELFVKPFGAQPPYCKPGKGGKILMANQNGERLQVVRDIETEILYADRIYSDIQTIEDFDLNDGLMTFEDPLDALELLDILQRHTDISIIEWPEGERFKIRYVANFGNLNMRMKSKIDWFELEGELNLDEDTVITIGQLLEMMRKGHGRFIELNKGEFIALSEQFKRRLSELSVFTTVSKKNVTINRFASAAIVDSMDDFENLKLDKVWRDFRKQVQKSHDINTDIPTALQGELRPYQEDGYRWMCRLSAWGAGACLADDMGLGKTVQAIAILLNRASNGPALVVSPVSVQPNWKSEVNRFAPTLNVKTLTAGDRSETLASIGAFDLLVVSYGLLQSEEEALASVDWATVVLDEAHAIKNYNTKTSKAAMSLKSGFRIILTGTPIQNHLGEMWNLFQFINPGLLGTLNHFTENFIKPEDINARKHLKKLISPFILRRIKSTVLDELPPKTEIIRKIELSKEEMAFYEALRRSAIEAIQKDEGPQGAKHLKALAEITKLRQACCNPKMVTPKIDLESTKLSVFMEIATELKENGHRALVFSQFVTHLAIVREALDSQGFKYQYLDGSTTTAKREEAVKKFQAGEGDLFLISLKAGGLGLNLTAADFVIHLDPWWNPAIEDQASDRAHRIGQDRPVTVYRLVAEHTIEEKIIQLHNTKRDLADSLLEGSDQSAKLSMEELLRLIVE